MFAQNFLTISFSFWSSLHAQNVPARNNIMLPTTTPRKTKVNSLFGSSWCTSETIPVVRFAVMFMTRWSVHVALSGLVQQYRSKFYILRLFQKLIAWLHSCSFLHTVEPPIKTTRKLSPFLSDQFSKTTKVSSQITIFGNSCKRPPLVSDQLTDKIEEKMDDNVVTLSHSWIVKETEISQWEVPDWLFTWIKLLKHRTSLSVTIC